jgi:hypothetical protein
LKITLQQAAVPPLAGFPARNFNRSIIGSLTPQQAAGNALAIAVHPLEFQLGRVMQVIHRHEAKSPKLSSRLPKTRVQINSKVSEFRGGLRIDIVCNFHYKPSLIFMACMCSALPGVGEGRMNCACVESPELGGG